MIEAIALKAFPQFTRDYIREEISYENLVYLLSTIPPYRGLNDDNKEEISKGKSTPKNKINNIHDFFQT